MHSNPAIVIIAYNRPKSLERLINSIVNANYVDYKDIHLVISIDGGENKNIEVKNIADSFYWEYGEKTIINHSENMGLRNHVITCGNLTETYESLIILEEDCFVSKNFYDFAVKLLQYYENDEKIAGISLYTYSVYESFNMPFKPLHDGYDCFFMQVPSSWGQAWTQKQWQNFITYYNSEPVISKNDKLPEKVKTWPESSWKKYFYKYIVEKNLFFVYPYLAFVTNFGDIGAHTSSKMQIYQVPLENYCRSKTYNFPAFDQSNNKYDAYYEILPECLRANDVKINIDTCIDIMGSKPLHLFDNTYALSIKNCKDPIKSYDNVLIPVIQNVIHKIQGNSFHYDFSKDFTDLAKSSKIQQIANSQMLGYITGKTKIITEKYYKIGYYICKPWKIVGIVKRKFNIKNTCL